MAPIKPGINTNIKHWNGKCILLFLSKLINWKCQGEEHGIVTCIRDNKVVEPVV